VLIAKVHPEIILNQHVPGYLSTGNIDDRFWKNRYKSINDFEQHAVNNGTEVIKFFLNVSKVEQAQRFLKRINEPEKNWKFTINDLEERKFWDEYQLAYETMIRETSTNYSPWYIIPADKKWYMRLAVAEVILERMKKLDLKYPVLTEKQISELQKGKQMLLKELS
jgi:polyphosphate kinase 2 (PPK2 family)